MALAELNIVVTQGVDNPIKIAVVPFAWEGSGVLTEDIAEVVGNDLRQVGAFEPLSRSNMLSMPKQESEVFFSDWRLLSQDYLLVGRISRAPSSQLVQVQYEFFDVNRELKLAGEILAGSVAQLRDIAHEISNVVYEQVSGIRGAFTTEILYIVAETLAPGEFLYRLEKSDYDGQRAQVLLETTQPIMSPSWSPDGTQVAYVSFETTLPRIYIQTIATGERRQITNYPNINSSPVWSPDGSKLAMVLSKDGSPDIYVQDLRTNELTRVTDHPAVETEPSWTHRWQIADFHVGPHRSAADLSDRTGGRFLGCRTINLRLFLLRQGQVTAGWAESGSCPKTDSTEPQLQYCDSKH